MIGQGNRLNLDTGANTIKRRGTSGNLLKKYEESDQD